MIQILLILLIISISSGIKVPKQSEYKPKMNFENQHKELLQDLQIDPIFLNTHHNESNRHQSGIELYQNLNHTLWQYGVHEIDFKKFETTLNSQLEVNNYQHNQSQNQLDSSQNGILIETKSHEDYQIARVTSSETHFTIRGFLFYLCLTVFIVFSTYLREWLQEHYSARTFKILLGGIKDLSLFIPIMCIFLIMNYVLPENQRQNLNYYGIMDFVDLDKLFIQIVVFILVWMVIAFSFSMIHKGQEEELLSMESCVHQQVSLLQQYENFYLHYSESPKLNSLKNKLQFLLIRQSFITPTFQISVVPQFLNSDFNFAGYISKCSVKIYISLMRISFVTLITFCLTLIIYIYIIELLQIEYIDYNFYLVCILIPLIIMGILQWFYKKQVFIQTMLVHQIDSPYGFKFNQDDKIHPFSNADKLPVPKYLQMEHQTGKHGKQTTLLFLNSKSLTIHFLHIILVLQTLYFIWLFFGYLGSGGIFDYTVCSLSIAISACNLLLQFPKIIALLSINLNMYGLASRKTLNSIINQQKSDQQKFSEKISHQLKAEYYIQKTGQRNSRRLQVQPDSQVQEEQNLFSLLPDQRAILKQAFIQTFQNDRYQNFEDEMQAYKQQLIEEEKAKKQNKLLANQQNDADKANEDDEEDDDDEEGEEKEERDLEQNRQIEQQNQQNLQNISIASSNPVIIDPDVIQLTDSEKLQQSLQKKREELIQQLQDFQEDTLVKLIDVPFLAHLCGGEMKIWYQVIFAEKFMKLNIVEDSIKFSDLIEYSGFNQYLVEQGLEATLKDLFKDKFQDLQMIQPLELQSFLLQGQTLTQSEIDYFVRTIRRLNPDKIEIQLAQLRNFILDQIILYPQ